MDQEIDYVNKIVYVKCTEKEKEKIVSELSKYLYGYEFIFVIEEKTEKLKKI